MKDITIKWNKQQDQLAGHKIEIKASQNLRIEARILQNLEYLKKNGGSFTFHEIDEYLTNSSIL